MSYPLREGDTAAGIVEFTLHRAPEDWWEAGGLVLEVLPPKEHHPGEVCRAKIQTGKYGVRTISWPSVGRMVRPESGRRDTSG